MRGPGLQRGEAETAPWLRVTAAKICFWPGMIHSANLDCG